MAAEREGSRRASRADEHSCPDSFLRHTACICSWGLILSLTSSIYSKEVFLACEESKPNLTRKNYIPYLTFGKTVPENCHRHGKNSGLFYLRRGRGQPAEGGSYQPSCYFQISVSLTFLILLPKPNSLNIESETFLL